MSGFPKQFVERLLEEAGGDEDELLHILDMMGLSMSEADGMNLVGLDDDDYNNDFDDDEFYYDESGKPRLPKAEIETFIQEVNKDQLVKIAKRFAPDTKAANVEPLKKSIQKALKSSKAIKAVIDNLTPLEEELLIELKRCGGVYNGWGLILHALRLGFQPENLGANTSLYRVDAADHPGVKFLRPLIRDCLLLPISTYASWFKRSYYGSAEQIIDFEDDVILADERILSALPDKAIPKAVVPKFSILKDIDTSGFKQENALAVILKLTEVIKLIEGSGGLQTNKDGSISKNAVKKLIKVAPWLEDELEAYVERIKSLDFLQLKDIDGKSTLQVNTDSFKNFQNMPFELSYNLLLDGFIRSQEKKYGMASQQYGLDGVVHPMFARRALLDTICTLPEEAVDLDAALKLMWETNLRYVMRAKFNRWTYSSSNKSEERDLPKWFRHTILEELHNYGLIAIKETGKISTKKAQASKGHYPDLDNTRYAIKLTKAKDWWYKGREFNRAIHISQPEDEAAYQKLVKKHLGEEHIKREKPKAPTQKSLLVQANFDILVYLDMLTPEAIAALNCADCTRIDAQTANYTISRSSVYRALEMGMELENILQLLKDNSHDLPNNVEVSIAEWASRRERLSITEKVNLLEFPDSKSRNTAHKKIQGSRLVAERFLLVPEEKEVHKVATTFHNYRAEPKRVIEFQQDGKFTLKGASDLAGRAVLANLATQDSKGKYELDTKAIQAGNFTKAAHESLLARTKGGLPAQLSVLISIWSGKTAAPAVGQVSIFQHASAKELSQHPSIAPLLDGQLGATSFLIKEAKATELNKVLKALGITPSKSVAHTVQPKVVQEDAMKKGLPTRKMREMIESAIASERKLKLKYNEEKHSYDRYGYTKISKGKVVTEEINPDSVYYEGSTPYFFGKTVDDDKGRDIRIGYIIEIAVL